MRKYLCEECKKAEKPKLLRECSGCKKTKAKAWYESNKDKYGQWRKRWRSANRAKYLDGSRQFHKRYRKENRALLTQKWKEFLAAHPGYSTMNAMRWRKANRGKWLAARKRRYSRKNYGSFAGAHRTLLELRKELKQEKG